MGMGQNCPKIPPILHYQGEMAGDLQVVLAVLEVPG